MDETNGIKAMLAHDARVGDDNNFTRGVIGDYIILGFGTVATYANERVNVICGNKLFTNVEVLVFGIDGWSIQPVPAPNDRVLLLTTQSAVVSVKEFKASGSMPAYDVSGLKAIPVTDSSVAKAQKITVNNLGLQLTGDNSLTINAQGITVQDKNNNKVIMTASGVTVQDKNSNEIEMTSSGVIINSKLQIKK